MRICFEKSIRQFVVLQRKSGISGKESAWICDSCFPGRNVYRTGLRADGRCGRIFQCSGKSGNEIAERTCFCSRIKFCVYGRCGTVYRKQFYNECSIYKGEVSWGKTIKVWIVCYLGNLLGSVVTAGIFMMTGLMNGQEVGTFLRNAAVAKVSAAPMELLQKRSSVTSVYVLRCGAASK